MATPWYDQRMASVDLETTSSDPEEARIVTASVLSVGGGLETETVTVLVNPGIEIPADATACHGITTAKAVADGRAPGPALNTIMSVLLKAIRQHCAVVVFNARYDLTVLDRELRRNWVPVCDPEDLGRALVFDPHVTDKHLDRYRKGSRRLEDVARHYRADPPMFVAHDSEADAYVTARLAWVLTHKAKVIRRVRNGKEGAEKAAVVRHWESVRDDLPALHAAQRAWAFEQASGLADHFESEHEGKYVEPAWPIIPFQMAAAA